MVTFAFTAFKPNYRCLVPQCENPGSAIYSSGGELPDFVQGLFPNDTLDRKSCQLPVITEAGDQGPPLASSRARESCEAFVENFHASNGSFETCGQEDLVFDTSIVRTTLAVKLGFTCDRAPLFNLFNAMYMVGMLLGAFFLGIFADKFGRLNGLLLSVVLLSGSGILGAFITGIPWLFALSRISCGMGGMGSYMIAFVMITESTTPRYIVPLTTFCGMGFILGELILGFYAYWIRDWFPLQLASYAPMVSGLLLYFLVPESTRWLLAKGKLSRARAELRNIAECNGREFPQSLFDRKDYQMAPEETKELPKPTLRDLFRPRTIMFRTLNMFFMWFSTSMAYFALTFASVSLAGDPYLNYILAILVECLAMPFDYVAMNFLGRRFMMAWSQYLLGVCSFLVGLMMTSPSLLAVQSVLFNLSKLGSSSGFYAVYIYTCELYPTNVRNTAVGSSSTCARIGAICGFLLGALSTFWRPLPLIVMGVVGCVAGTMALFFPETAGEGLPETMEEALNLGKSGKFKMCQWSNVPR